MHVYLYNIINLIMDSRNYGLYRRYTKKTFTNRGKGHFGLFRDRIPLTPENIFLLILPLLLMLILIPPPKEVTEEKTDIPVKEEEIEPISIVVFNNADSVIDKADLEEYLIGVVAAEMPHSYHQEALKAQAVAARTFAVSRARGLYGIFTEHFGADVCTDSNHCQSWISKDEFLESRGDESDWEKIAGAVANTRNMVITYEGQLINPLYHSNSGGATENIENVWPKLGAVPYLKSVYSPYETEYGEYIKSTVIKWDDIKNKLKNKYPKAELKDDPAEDIEVLSYSASGRIKRIRIGSIEMEGTEFRELLKLPSTYLEFSFPDEKSVEIVSKGFGHGVGMSQCGADALAKKGYTYKEILEFYYTGISVEELKH
ncbi:MAG: stage II sporulation protein D [Clostridiaceae bacterium]|nr:stage II sporulation protein D [Clostridiaceae bacterium]